MKLPATFERYRPALDQELRSLLAGRELPLYAMLSYHLGWAVAAGLASNGSTGKALRPTLCLLACEAVGADYRQVLPAAAALELVHNFSLVHDDIQDGDQERHHRATVWSLWGQGQGINTGNALRVLASLALLRLEVPWGRQLQAFRLLDEACLEMVEGQYLDLAFETQARVTPEQYLAMITRKTAALIRCSLQIGAVLGGAQNGAVAGLGRFGYHLGLAFQIRDDILGIWGDAGTTGKPSADIRRRKKTFPVVYALEKSSLVRHAYDKTPLDEADVALVLAELETVDARGYAQRTARHYCCQARACLESLSLEPAYRRELEETSSFLVERDY
ncbi:MAG: polyprenyl synthetase family protein [Chloroflexota bacterium]|nr:polyprenyl synthetase family protein [Chloroflexota bacterium]